MISIVLPVYNEELILKENTLKVFDFCSSNLPGQWQIIISDNASTDKTEQIAKELSRAHEQIKYKKINSKGKGYGVIEAWQAYPSQIYVYMDADLATDIKALPDLIDNINKGNHIVTGSRYHQSAKVERSFRRKVFSRTLRFILKILFNLSVKDAPCGFKAVNQQVVSEILPSIRNKTWFFDTEMLILSQRARLKIKEIPVIWQESPNAARKSKVSTFTVIKDYITNIISIYGRK
jgi:glycosyltransferase involved in cell wall biosynthesis